MAPRRVGCGGCHAHDADTDAERFLSLVNNTMMNLFVAACCDDSVGAWGLSQVSDATLALGESETTSMRTPLTRGEGVDSHLMASCVFRGAVHLPVVLKAIRGAQHGARSGF